MTLGCLAAGCSLVGSLITPSVMAHAAGANWMCSVGLLSSLALIVMGADPIGPWVPVLTLRAVKDSNWAGGLWGLVPVCRALSVRANGSIGPLNLQ